MEVQGKGPTDGTTNAGWPFGRGSHSHDRLASHLLDVGKRHALRALSLYSSEKEFDMLDAAFSAGSAVELLAKSLLASVSPVLLASPNNSDIWSLLRFAGATVPEGEIPSGAKVKSIDANQSIERLRHLGMIPLPWSQGDSAAVFEVRNAAAHMGLVDREALSSAMRLVVRFSEYVRIRLDQGTDEWWGKNLSLVVEQLLNEGLSELERAVQAKLASARLSFEETWGARPQELVKALLESVRYSRPEGSFSSTYKECPVCGHLGLAYGYTSEEECLVKLPHPDGGFWLNPYLGLAEFACSSCGLHLVGDAELRLAGLDAQIGSMPPGDTPGGAQG